MDIIEISHQLLNEVDVIGHFESVRWKEFKTEWMDCFKIDVYRDSKNFGAG